MTLPAEDAASEVAASSLEPGLYELLVTGTVDRAVSRLGDRAVLEELDVAEAAQYLSDHVRGVLLRVLRAPGFGGDLERQVGLCNALIQALESAAPAAAATQSDAVSRARLLLSVLGAGSRGLGTTPQVPRPTTPLSQDALLVHAPHEPGLASELGRELASADRVDLLCAFVVWSGVRVLLEPLRRIRERGVPVRVITTTYTGTTEPRALDELARLGAEIRVSYDTRATRLHAKAWLFERASGFSTAYVGSSNLTHSALHDGLEWNVRLSQVSSPDLLERFRATFATYWADSHFEPYEPERFAKAIRQQRSPSSTPLTLFDLRPYPFQEEILDRLEVERVRHGRWRNLLVAATGTGKTVVSAFDYRRIREQWGKARLLFVAHRREILEQSLATFRTVLRDGSFGELFVGNEHPGAGEHVFASIQSLNRLDLRSIDPAFYDVVIVDEFHHAEAPTYRRLLEHLTPRLLLGMTATPERADGLDVTGWFDGRIAVELRLWEALNQGLLCPFQYFGVADDVDLSRIQWRRGGYDAAALSGLYTGNDARLAKVLRALREFVRDPLQMRALGFCVSVEHAHYMAERFTAAGIPARAISGDSTLEERRAAIEQLRQRDINALFSVDLFNEGLDVPEVDTVLFLRPTESPTVFLQQLGRGLRHSRSKDGLTVLDFIGQQHRQFRYEPRFAALTGARQRELVHQIQEGFPYLPAGCSIQLDRVAQEVVLSNVRAAVQGARQAVLADELRRLGDVSLLTYLRETGRSLEEVYRSSESGWSTLRRLAGFGPQSGPDEQQLARAVTRMRHIDDEERVAFYRTIVSRQEVPSLLQCASNREQRLLTMLHFDLWGADRRFGSLEESFQQLWKHPAILQEIEQLLEVLEEQASHVSFETALGAEVPLRVHARYTRNEVLAAFGDATVERPPSMREGVRYLPASKTDIFLVTLRKTPGRFSPSTMYRDYAISPTLFHWESQSTTAAGSPTGQRYIHHAERGTRVCLFAREAHKDASGTTRAYLFLGTSSYVQHQGERPLAITWRLDRSLPPDFYQEARAAA